MRRFGLLGGGAVRGLSVISEVLQFLNPKPQLGLDELVLWRAGRGKDATSPSMPNSNSGGIAAWRCVDDNDYGGKSQSSATAHEEEGGFVRFGGSVAFDKDLADAKKVKGGFCAVIGKCTPTVDLRDFAGIEFSLRSIQPQTFTINLKCASLIEDDMYQVRCELAGSAVWRRIRVPFDKFHLTARGMERETNRANDSLQVESVGFLFKENDLPRERQLSLDLREVKAFA